MESFMEQLNVFANLLYVVFAACCPLFLELKTIICSLIEYKLTAQVLIKKVEKGGHCMDNHPQNEAFIPREIQSTG